MPRLIFWIVIIVILVSLSSSLRRIVFHVQVRRYIVIFLILCFFTGLGAAGYLVWKYWLSLAVSVPTVEWNDITVDIDEQPVTPGTGGPARPVIIQTR